MSETQVVESQSAQFFSPEFDGPQQFSDKAAPAKDAPVEQAKPAEEAEKQAESAESTQEVNAEKPEGKPDQSRSREAYLARQARRQAEEATARVEALERRIAELAGADRQAAEAQKLERPKRPSPNDPKYGDLKQWDPQYEADVAQYQEQYEEYIEARAGYKALEATQHARAEAERAREVAELAVTAETAYKKGVDKHADFDEVVRDAFEAMPISAEADSALSGIENVEDVLYHLGKHPEELERITALGPMTQVLELGKISARLASSAKVGVKVTQSQPTPQQPRGAGGKFSNESDARYEKMLKAQTAW